MEIEVKKLPPMRVAIVAHTGPYQQIGPAFQRLAELAGRAGLFLPGAQMLGLYFDDPRTVPAEKLRSAAAITLSHGTPVPDGLTEANVPGGRYACVNHLGSYDGLPATWQRFVQAFGAAHQRGAGPSLEVYRNTPETVPVDELVTELCVPIA
jgi:AraC family transcriptional regulator